MIKPAAIRTVAVCIGLGLWAQPGPNLFELWLPDFFETPFKGSHGLIEVPDRQIRRLSVLIREARQRDLNPGRYRVFVNGKGLGNVLEERTTLDGTLLVMEPETLRKRPDELFDPRENAIEIMAEDRRGRAYYQNWIVRVNDTHRNALFGYSSTISPDDPRAVPPDLIISEPAVPPVLRTNSQPAQILVRGRVSGGSSLRINGQSAGQARPGAYFNFEHSARVLPEQRELLIEAADARGNSRKVIIPVFGPPTPQTPVRSVGRRYAVLIGISSFGAGAQSPPPLPLAAAEVQMFAQMLYKSGFQPENVRLLIDERATLELVRVAFSDFAAKAQSNDTLFIYIATHGLHDPRPNRGGKLFLALHGTQLASLDSTALPFSDLQRLLNASVRTGQCFLIFDIAHQLDDNWRFRAGLSLVNNHIFSLFSDQPGWAILVSGSSGETARNRDSASNLFQYWFTQALKGSADLNGDRVLTAREVFAFVSERVKSDSGGAQQPRFRITEESAQRVFGSL